MTVEQFEEKWYSNIPTKWQGYAISIDDENVLSYLDKQFTILHETDPEFEIHQIKLKFGQARVYLQTTDKLVEARLEVGINLILARNES